MEIEKLIKQIDFITEIDKLKKVFRQTILLDGSRSENDPEHSWHMALAAMVLMEYSNCKEIDINKVIKMALIHDIVEIDAGDVYAYDNANREEIQEKENIAAERIFGLLPPGQAEEFLKLRNEFEEGITPEAKFTHAIDSFMPMLHNYKTKGLEWQKHGVTAEKVLERNKRIERGSEFLGSYMKSLIEDAVKKGYLKEK